MSAIGQKFHTECFTCFQCHRPIRSGLFHLENGEPYCDEGMMKSQVVIASRLNILLVLLHWSKLISPIILAIRFSTVYQFLVLIVVDGITYFDLMPPPNIMWPDA